MATALFGLCRARASALGTSASHSTRPMRPGWSSCLDITNTCSASQPIIERHAAATKFGCANGELPVEVLMPANNPTPAEIASQLPDAHKATTDSILHVKTSEGFSEKLVDAIEMIGEESAAGLPPADHGGVTPGMRYLHCSRTIHQLVTDRNRAVGIYLAVASLLITASSFISNARPQSDLIIPVEKLHRWVLPITFGSLAVLSVLIALLLVRTRVGLIYEV